jgi:signal transduction histidine kinase
VSANGPQRQLAEAQESIRALQEELAETNRGLLALTLELEQRVDERTQELRTAHAELEKTNSELLQLTLELEDRVAARTAELQVKSEEVTAMSQQLWQAAKLATMGELAASIAHELNNPLATVSLRVEALLGQMAPDAPQRRALEVIEQEVERMGNLVANLLQFTRRSPQQISTLDVREEIERTLELIHYHLRNHRITVIREFASDVPLVQADRQQLRQLFLNLFTNASDAMPQGGTLTIRVSAMSSPPASQVAIDIADTGGGIASEDLPKVMEPFFTTKAAGKGTGLGLPICRRIIQEHHGTLDLASALGQGTTVHIALPVHSGESGAFLRDA